MNWLGKSLAACAILAASALPESAPAAEVQPPVEAPAEQASPAVAEAPAGKLDLNSATVAGLTANPAFSDFRIQHYSVLEELSRITGTPQVAVA